MIKKLTVFIAIFSLGFTMSILPTKANEGTASESKEALVSEFIESIEKNENSEIDLEDIISTEYIEEYGYISILIEDESGDLTLYENYSNASALNMYGDTQLASSRVNPLEIWGVVESIWNFGKITCSVITQYSGRNVCGIVGMALLQSMVPKAHYQIQRIYVKNPNCQPMHSYHCNSAAGGAYWQTKAVRVR